MSEILKDALKPFPHDFPAILGTKKAHEHWARGLFFTIVSGGPSRTEAEHHRP